MLSPIPSVMLKDVATFHVPVSLNDYQMPVYQDYVVKKVHIQNSNEVKRTSTNEEVVLKAILFVDGKKSAPILDYMSLMKMAEAVGADMTVTVTESNGNEHEYTVTIVDAVPDVPAIRTHHTEIGLI